MIDRGVKRLSNDNVFEFTHGFRMFIKQAIPNITDDLAINKRSQTID